MTYVDPRYVVWWRPSTGEVVAVAELGAMVEHERDEAPTFTIGERPPDTADLPLCTGKPGCDADMHVLRCPNLTPDDDLDEQEDQCPHRQGMTTVDYIRDLVDSHTNIELYTVRERGQWLTRRHATKAPALLDQLWANDIPSGAARRLLLEARRAPRRPRHRGPDRPGRRSVDH